MQTSGWIDALPLGIHSSTETIHFIVTMAANYLLPMGSGTMSALGGMIDILYEDADNEGDEETKSILGRMRAMEEVVINDIEAAALIAAKAGVVVAGVAIATIVAVYA